MARDPTASPSASAAQLARIATARGLSLHTATALMRRRGLTAESLTSMPEPTLRRAVRRLLYPDLPREREKFRALHLQVDRTEGVLSRFAATNHRLRALRHQDSLRLRVTRASVAGVPVGIVASAAALAPLTAAGGIGPATWAPLGPGNVGGRTRAIVPDPDTAQRVWLGSAGGGIWRSDDGGQSWIPVDDLMADLAVCSLAISPVKDAQGRRLMLAGTGEGFGNIDAIMGAGVFSSLGGQTWSPLASTQTADFPQINRIAISSDGAAVLVATPKGLMRSTTPQLSTWTKVLSAAMGDVRCHPTNPALAVAGSLTGDAYVSSDGGLSWKTATHAATWGGRVEVTYAAANPNVVYASVDLSSGSIWRSSNGGKSFKRMASKTAKKQPANYLGDQGWYANAIWAGDPHNANAVIVGGLDLWRSADGGASLTQISLWYVDGSVHADHHAIVGDPSLGKPGAPNRVFFGNDGGVFKTDDYATVGADANKTQGWVRLENGYGVTQFYGAAGHAATGDIIGGAQDNGTVRYTTAGGPNAWTSMFGGDGGWCAADPGDPNYFYGEYVYAQIHRSQDAGKTADYICGQFYDPHRGWSWKPVPYQIPDARAQRALFIAPFVIDPSNPSTILVGAMSLWRTLDAKTANDDVAQTGPSWSEIKPSLNIPISALAIDPTNSNAIWVGDQTGQVFATSNGTGALPQWRQIAGGAGSPLSLNRYCSSVLISGGEIYVTFAAYRGGVPGSNVWRTTDGGQTFTDLGQALPDAPVHKIAKHPTKPGYLYVGTEIGLFASDDDGATWAPTNEGPTNSPVYDLIWMNNALVCCTHGRGMWKIDI